MKRASYRDAIDLIAFNDEPLEFDPENVLGMATVMLVANIFGVPQVRVAQDVVRLRKKDQAMKNRAYNDGGFIL